MDSTSVLISCNYDGLVNNLFCNLMFSNMVVRSVILPFPPKPGWTNEMSWGTNTFSSFFFCNEGIRWKLVIDIYALYCEEISPPGLLVEH